MSAYDAFVAMMSNFSPEEQEAPANADIEFDMSSLELETLADVDDPETLGIN